MGIINRTYPSDLRTVVTRDLARGRHVTLERLGRASRTMASADRAFRDARACEMSESDRRARITVAPATDTADLIVIIA